MSHNAEMNAAFAEAAARAKRAITSARAAAEAIAAENMRRLQAALDRQAGLTSNSSTEELTSIIQRAEGFDRTMKSFAWLLTEGYGK
jgi:vacuolar-type H+-ATPase subunit E/Vma4